MPRSKETIQQAVGSPLINSPVFCCRHQVDPSGPLATLRRLLLSDESIASLKRWVEDHWYGVLFIAVGFISVVVSTVSTLSLFFIIFSFNINRHRYACCLTGARKMFRLCMLCVSNPVNSKTRHLSVAKFAKEKIVHHETLIMMSPLPKSFTLGRRHFALIEEPVVV